MTYTRYISLTDAGAFLTKLILPMPETVAEGAVTPDTFSVFIHRANRTTGETIRLVRKHVSAEVMTDTEEGLSWGYARIRAAYPCTELGAPVSRGEYVALDMEYGPTIHLSAMGAQAKGPYNDFVDMTIRVTQTAKIPGSVKCMGLVYDSCKETLCPALDGWAFRDETDSAHPLRYGFYAPNQKAEEKKPLLVWLHGAGGGGKDPRYPVAGNRVTGFSSPEGQKALGGAWILVPQCPTMWMDDGKGTPLMETNDSMYVEAVKTAVDTFIAEHAEMIDTDQIFIAGNSNGGFMAVKQCIAYPDFYAAGVPVCEAVMTELVTQEEFDALKNVPLWFVHCKGDFVVDPDRSVVPLVQKLKSGGAREVHFTYLDRIVDTSGVFRNADGSPYQYIPHFAWVPVYNNACREDCDGTPVVKNGFKVGIFEWLRSIRLSDRA